MNKPAILTLLLTLLFLSHPSSSSSPRSRASEITVMGKVYCDICSNNTFSAHSFFMAQIEVQIDCKFKVVTPKISGALSFSINATTNKIGMYKLEVPMIEGTQCGKKYEQSDYSIVAHCHASVVGNVSYPSSTSSSGSDRPRCDVPGYKSTSDVVNFRATRRNVCVYELSDLSYRPREKSRALCGN